MNRVSTFNVGKPATGVDGDGLSIPARGSDIRADIRMESSPKGERDNNSITLHDNVPHFAQVAWGKSVINRSGDSDFVDDRWLPLITHLYDTVGIAEAVWDRMVSYQVKRIIMRAGKMDLDRAKRIYLFMCGIHDIGKASREFIYKNPRLQQQFQSVFPDLDVTEPPNSVRHEAVSHYEFVEWMYVKMGQGLPAAMTAADSRKHRKRYACVSSWGTVVGGHHGTLPNSESGTRLASPIDRGETYRRGIVQREEWRNHRHMMIDALMEASGLTDQDVAHMFATPLHGTGQMLMCSMVIVADWMSSNEELCSLGDAETPQMPDADRVRDALRKLGIPDTWTPTDAFYTNFRDTFKERFMKAGSSTDFAPRPVQAALRTHIDMYAEQDGGMFIIVEDATGSGKTEAGLAAAEMLAYRSGARGVMVALPTMATSNAMFGRIRSWIGNLGQDGKFATQLIHSQAALNDDRRALRRVGMQHPATVRTLCCDDPDGRESTAVVHSWMTGSKKSILSDFVVGTIDQVLYTALNRKHAMLPHLGLAQKVLIIDEVHDHDVYMRQFLVCVLKWLGAYGVPVVALSATLTPEVRAELHAAYMGVNVESPELVPANTRAYPLITSSFHGDKVQVTDNIDAVERTKEVAVEMCEGDDELSVVEILRSNAGGSGCVAVICNTVTRAQKVFSAVRSEMGKDGWEVELMHSRYTIEDRTSRESALVKKIGPDDGGSRPTKYILIGTQVLEQSLDVDFDLMVSDLCPASALIQRMGRLHRHRRDNRTEQHMSPKIIVTGFTYSGDVLKIPSGTRIVYGTCAPILTGALLKSVNTLTTPSDVPSLVLDSYSPAALDKIPSEWAETYTNAAGKESKELTLSKQRADKWLIPNPPNEETVLMNGWTPPVKDSNEEYASVRDSVMDKTALIMYEEEGVLYILSGDKYVPVTGDAPYRNPRQLVLSVARQEVRLPKSARGVTTRRLYDVAREYTFRWDIEKFKWLVDDKSHVLIMDKSNHTISSRSSTKLVAYDKFNGLECVEI